MQAKAIFHRKEASYDPRECEIEKVIHLSDSDFARFQQMLLDNYDFLHENADLMRVENGVTHCLLVVGETFEDGILVNSEGSDYARYSAYFPNAKSYLLTHGQGPEVKQAEATPVVAESPSAVGGISAALLAYGEKMGRIVDASIQQALDGHDQSTYIISIQELHDIYDNDVIDDSLFIAMLKERPEIVDMDVSDGDVMITLSLESIIEHDLSKMRVLTQQDLEVMYAKHILFTYSEGGEQADFTNCRLTNLDMRHMQLNGANFTEALLENVKMNSAGVCFGVFRDAKLVGCNLTGIYAEEADFCGAVFEECKMQNGIYTNSNFAHAQFHDSDLWMSDFSSCCIEGTNIMDTETEGVNLSNTSDDEESWVNDPGIRVGGMGGM